jgi:hypothetical protein
MGDLFNYLLVYFSIIFQLIKKLILSTERRKKMKNLNNYLDHKEKLKIALIGKYLFQNLKLRFGILLIIIGLLWFGKTIGWFASDIFGPLVMLATGIWFIFTYFVNRITYKYNNWMSSLELKQGDFDGL